MNSDFPDIKWRSSRGRTKEKKNQLSINDLNQIDKRDELFDLLEEKYEFIQPFQKLKKKLR